MPRTEVLVCAVPLVCAGAVHADELVGKVVKVADGDTLTILVGGQAHRVRLAEIDAPEKKQPFGNRSKQNLTRLAHGKEARADCPKRDRYRRLVCKVWVQPADCRTCGLTLEVGLAQISAGLAWWYRAYAREQSPQNRAQYEFEEREARSRRLGLWADPAPVEPWEWRRAARSPRNPPK